MAALPPNNVPAAEVLFELAPNKPPPVEAVEVAGEAPNRVPAGEELLATKKS